MGTFETLLLAIGNVAFPGIGFFANIVSAISSDGKNAGSRFIFDLATNVLPSNFFIDLAAGLVADAIFMSSADSATNLIVPNNVVIAPCEKCGNFIHKYVRRNGKILCANCVSSEIDGHLIGDSRIYIYKKTVSNLHGRFIVANNLGSRQLVSKQLKGRSI